MKRSFGIFLAILTLATSSLAEIPAVAGPQNPAENDQLIKQYMASKDPRYLIAMLSTYNDANDTLLKDARRYALLTMVFNNPKNPRPDLKSRVAKAACAKYECATNVTLRNQFFTLATGMWALDSLSNQDPAISQIVSDFLQGHPRMAKLYHEEAVLFSNYHALFMVSFAKPALLDSILTRYEEFGPLDIAAAKQALDQETAKPH